MMVNISSSIQLVAFGNRPIMQGFIIRPSYLFYIIRDARDIRNVFDFKCALKRQC